VGILCGNRNGRRSWYLDSAKAAARREQGNARVQSDGELDIDNIFRVFKVDFTAAFKVSWTRLFSYADISVSHRYANANAC
jgi:hypothetical protein